MPINKIKSSNRARNAIAAAMAVATLVGGRYMVAKPNEAPMPASVRVAVDKLIMPWESLVLSSHWDRYAKIWDICYGETKGVGPGMTKTKAECDAILTARVYDYYKPLTKCIAGFDRKPISLQASLISLAYNYGAERTCVTNGARQTRAGNYLAACLALTSINRAGGEVVEGLVRRREMGDAQRIGEAELCVSGLQ
ncbi:glycoside hydrolase family protein [Mesorhizobium sp. M1340]|uniref:glycoside hydrolase family protein n=1 Tax=Mesorhizobium sp. M1340 TaxID=2957087 RepID=UPI0033380796